MDSKGSVPNRLVTIDSNWENELLGEHQVIAAAHGLHVNIEVINAESPEYLAAPPIIYWGDLEGKSAGDAPIRILLHGAHYYPVVEKGSWPNRKEGVLLSADPAAYHQSVTTIPTNIGTTNPDFDNISSPVGSISTIIMNDKSTSMTPIEDISHEFIPIATSPNPKLLPAPRKLRTAPNAKSIQSPSAAADTIPIHTMQESDLRMKTKILFSPKDLLIGAGAGLLAVIVSTVATVGIIEGFRKLTRSWRERKWQKNKAVARKKFDIRDADEEAIATARW